MNILFPVVETWRGAEGGGGLGRYVSYFARTLKAKPLRNGRVVLRPVDFLIDFFFFFTDSTVREVIAFSSPHAVFHPSPSLPPYVSQSLSVFFSLHFVSVSVPVSVCLSVCPSLCLRLSLSLGLSDQKLLYYLSSCPLEHIAACSPWMFLVVNRV